MGIRQLDLCSGVGSGFPNAGLQLGFELVGLCENDQWCDGILSKRFPGLPIVADVRSCDWGVEQFRPDLITASPPCQPFSIQGQRLGGADKRDCFPAVLRAIALLKPKYFAIENVRGLLTCPAFPGTNRLYFGGLLKDLQSIGYDAEWQIVSSGHFAAPWRRERLLLVGVARSLELQWERAIAWSEQIRSATAEVGSDRQNRSRQPGVSRDRFQSAYWLVRSERDAICFGVDSGDATIRRRRQALGNALDPRVAKVALERILYYDSLVNSLVEVSQ